MAVDQEPIDARRGRDRGEMRRQTCLIDLELSRHRHDRGGMNAAKAIAECLRHLAGHRSRAR
ncbi:hypothetical protein AB7M42_003427 [Bradyrhizobium diazoefficiens]|nr:hypothetical protein [Bradyrhizobium japonicum]